MMISGSRWREVGDKPNCFATAAASEAVASRSRMPIRPCKAKSTMDMAGRMWLERRELGRANSSVSGLHPNSPEEFQDQLSLFGGQVLLPFVGGIDKLDRSHVAFETGIPRQFA